MLGLTKVKNGCKKIERYARENDDARITDKPDAEECLSRIKDTLVAVKEAYTEAESILKKFYES